MSSTRRRPGVITDAAYRQLLDVLPVAVVVFAGGFSIYVNDTACTLLEAGGPEELLGLSVAEFIHPLDRGLVHERLHNLSQGRDANFPTEMRILTRKGQMRRLTTTSMTVRLGQQKTIMVIATDSTKRYETEPRRHDTEKDFQQLFESTQDVYYQTNADGFVLNVGPAVRHVLGYRPDEIIGRRAEEFYPHPGERDALKQALHTQGQVIDFEGRIVRRDGAIIDISISSYALYSDQGEFLGVEGIYRDVTERKNLERELRRLATTDSLTGIANRRAFLEHATMALTRTIGTRTRLVLFIVDLDHFKIINDRYGHTAGDLVLTRFVTSVNAELRTIDLFGRLGGEEFGVVLPEISRDQATAIAERIGACAHDLHFSSPDGEPYGVTVSIGATTNHLDDRGIERLLVRADMALYAAKEAGRDCVRWWD